MAWKALAGALWYRPKSMAAISAMSDCHTLSFAVDGPRFCMIVEGVERLIDPP